MHSFSEPGRVRLARPYLLVAAAIVLVVALSQAPRASADHYHTNCVGHGYVHGSDNWDNSFHSRVEAGCGNPGRKTCKLQEAYGTIFKSEYVVAGVNATCNTWSNYEYGEQAANAIVDFNYVFGSHHHFPH